MKRLFLIRAALGLESLSRWSAERGLVRRGGVDRGFDEGLALHHLLDELFGPRAIKPFRLLVPAGGHTASLYGYSEYDSEELREAAAMYGLPEHIKVIQPSKVEAKRMPLEWKRGQRLGFDLRVRPVRRLGAPLGNGETAFRKGAELDAFLVEALRQHPRSDMGVPKGSRSREIVYLDWLGERLESAAEIHREATKLTKFQRVCVSRGSFGPEGPDAIFHGALTIKNSNKFMELLARGVGRHRSYGYGMILLRPPVQRRQRKYA